MLHNAGNSSIQLLRRTVGLAIFFLAAAVHAQSLNSERPKTVGEGFETMMLQMVYQQMRASNAAFASQGADYFAPSHAEKIYRDMLDQSVVLSAAKRSPIGVGKLVDRYLEGKAGIRRQPQVKSRLVGQEGEKYGSQ